MNFPLQNCPYELYFELRPDYLYVYVSADETNLDIATQYWMEILDMLHRRCYNKVLVEKNIPERLTQDDLNELILKLTGAGCRSIAFAIVDQHYEEARGEMEQIAAASRGVHLRVMENAGQAEDWLGSAGAKKPVYISAGVIIAAAERANL